MSQWHLECGKSPVPYFQNCIPDQWVLKLALLGLHHPIRERGNGVGPKFTQSQIADIDLRGHLGDGPSTTIRDSGGIHSSIRRSQLNISTNIERRHIKARICYLKMQGSSYFNIKTTITIYIHDATGRRHKITSGPSNRRSTKPASGYNRNTTSTKCFITTKCLARRCYYTWMCCIGRLHR